MTFRFSVLRAIALFACAAAALGQEPAPGLCELWEGPYTGADANGTHVIALWQFAAGKELDDSSGHGHTLALEGAVINPDGKFGPCLESFPGYPVEDKCHAAIAANHPALSPVGAFTLEFWLKPKPAITNCAEVFLLDKKYVSHSDYQLTLSAPDDAGQRRLIATLGFGTDSETYTSDLAAYPLHQWHHVTFTYDGAGGVRFLRDGAPLGGGSKPGRGAIMAGQHPLSIGDRLGSYYNGFPGFIAQVRLSNRALEFRPAAIALASDRTSFVRMEKTPRLRFAVTNLQRSPLAGARAVIAFENAAEQVFPLPEMAVGAQHTLEYPLDTSLRPGEYKLRMRLEIPGATPYRGEETCVITLVARPLPHRMPVLMWGLYDPPSVLRELSRLKDLGFTHCLGFSADYSRIWEAGQPTAPAKAEEVAAAKRMLNVALANDLAIAANLSPATWLLPRQELRRVGRNGKPREAKEPDICGLSSGLSNFCFNVGVSAARTYGEFPAFQSALLHTEARDAADLCFHEHDRAAYRRATGLEIPDEVKDKSGLRFEKLKDFPASHVIPDDHPVLRYLRWYWQEGDGWNGLNTALHRGLKSAGRVDLWTFHDPAARVASTYGSGGEVDVLSHWTYSYPDPIRIGLATDELLAMAGGAPQRQRVMKMTQIIWYRSQTAPAHKDDATGKAPKSPWEDRDPDAAFPTIAPMHLREAFWSKLSRPIQGIMYHGWESLVPTESTGAYRYTHPQTQHELRRLIKEVVEPLGPTLLQVPDRPSNVAFLKSFASEMFAGRGTYGWSGGWAGDAYLILQYAQLQPAIVFDETIAAHGLEDYRVLVMMDCDVLTETVARKAKAFQQSGGVIIGDERLAPALKPDILVESYKRTGKADLDRAALLARAGKLRASLDGHYRRYADSSNADIVTRCRQSGETDYLFAVNDRREFGDYVGRHGLVMEDGLPAEAVLSLARSQGCIYDLVNGQPVKTKPADKGLSFQKRFGPCEGGVFMVTEQPIAGVRIEASEQAKLGESLVVNVSVVDPQGSSLRAVVPVRVDILDPSGRAAEFTGFYGAKEGQLRVRLDLARNDLPGVWQVRARELASRQCAEHYFRVMRP